MQTDSGDGIWSLPITETPTQLAWSADGSRLLALAPGRMSLFDARGRVLREVPFARGTRAVSAAFAPSGQAFALSTYSSARNRSRLTLMGVGTAGATQRLLLAGAGRFGQIAWSPDGRWLVAEWPDADQWVFIRIRPGGSEGIRRLTAVANIADQFDPGRTRDFPQIQGWCCPR
jgi:dipeptidyl aminopeptidase/acylaminoacyl peptidase